MQSLLKIGCQTKRLTTCHGPFNVKRILPSKAEEAEPPFKQKATWTDDGRYQRKVKDSWSFLGQKLAWSMRACSLCSTA